MIAAATTLIAVTWIAPLYPREQWLQHAATIPLLVAAVVAARRRWLSDAAIACCLAFLLLHALAARWIYSYVPYETWCDAAFGSGPAEWFGWRRNHFDRLVHVAFGVLLTPPLRELAQRAGLRPVAACATAWLTVAGASACYEVFEWLLAVVAAPEMAERYNGQQGDPWDAQKDMALAMAGSTAVLAWYALRAKIKRQRHP